VSGLPCGWKVERIGDICEPSQYGYTAKAKSSGSVHYLRTTDITSGAVEWDTVPFCELTEAEAAKYLLADGDVVISRAGSVGYSHLVRSPQRSVFASYLIRFRPLISPDYFAYFLNTPEYWSAISEQSMGIAVQNVNATKLAEIEIPVAPRAEQTRIVEKLEELLGSLDAAVAELKAAQRKLGHYRQSLLKAAMEGALTAQWRAAQAVPPLPPGEGRGEGLPAKKQPSSALRAPSPEGRRNSSGADLLHRILQARRTRWEEKQQAKFAQTGKAPPKGWQAKYPEPVAPDTTDLPALPDGWVWATIDQLSFVVRGASPRPAGDPQFFGGDIPWITVGSLTADETMYLDSVEQFVTPAGRDASRYIEPNTLLLTNSGATLGVPKITRIGGCINDGSVALLDVEQPMRTYLYWFLRTQTKRLRAMNQGAAQPNLNTDIVRNICVPLCGLAEMFQINETLEKSVDAISAQQTAITHALHQAAAQRRNLLRAAFSGQLVPQDPNDEPASALLARIRAARADNAKPAAAKRGRKSKATA